MISKETEKIIDSFYKGTRSLNCLLNKLCKEAENGEVQNSVGKRAYHL